MIVKKEPAVQLNELALNLQNVSAGKGLYNNRETGRKTILNFIIYQDPCIHRTCFHNIRAVP